MKNIFKSITVVLLFIFLLPVFGCKIPWTEYLQIYTLYCDLNGGSYTQAFIDENELDGGKTYRASINLNYYEGALRILPQAEEMTAPEGKAFAGWYYDKDCTAGQKISEHNLKARIATKEQTSGETVYAKWIDDSTVDVVLDLNDTSLSVLPQFTDSYKTAKGVTDSVVVNVSRASVFNAIASLPTADDFVLPEGKVFAGYSDYSGAMLSTSETTLSSRLPTQGESVVKVYAIYEEEAYASLNYSVAAFYYDDREMNWIPAFFTSSVQEKFAKSLLSKSVTESACDVYYHCRYSNIDEVFENVPTIEDLEPCDGCTDFEKYSVTGWQLLVTEEDDTGHEVVKLVDFTKENLILYKTSDYGPNFFMLLAKVEIAE
ncbi:MAG: hypothetical protein MJ072_02970 [Clostridia bacterium]|nr:hypothetical protein [Clostridia bacterium]